MILIESGILKVEIKEKQSTFNNRTLPIGCCISFELQVSGAIEIFCNNNTDGCPKYTGECFLNEDCFNPELKEDQKKKEKKTEGD